MVSELVQVAVPLASIEGPLTYALPAPEVGRCPPGVRVRVRVAGRPVVGVALGPPDEVPDVNLRLIEEVLDREPVVTERQIELARFVSRYYLSTIGECLRLVLPPDTARVEQSRYRLTERGAAARVFGAAHGLKAKDQALLEDLQLDLEQTARKLGATPRRLNNLVELGLVHARRPSPVGKVRTDPYVRILENGEPLPARAPALAALDAWLRVQDYAPRLSETAVLFPGVRGKLLRLAALNRLVLDEAITAAKRREGLAAKAPATDLTAEQNEAIAALVGAIGQDSPPSFLLEGVTGSGKTEVYLEALRATLAKGRGALLVVPEIALTPQLLSRVEGALCAADPQETQDGDLAAAEAHAPREASSPGVVTLHSGLGKAERRDALARLRSGEARVALGARSALFAPVPDLGLIIVDEEHEPSLKQDESPRYHGRDVALWRAKNEGAVCVLGSATPSLESRHNADTGKLTHLRLTRRVGGGGTLPEVRVIDLRARAQIRQAKALDRAKVDGVGVVLSAPLVTAMRSVLEAGEQVLLFLNRRGWSSSILCGSCGEMLECSDCTVSLTWHRNRNALLCHQCDMQVQPPKACPACGGPLVGLGLGTERVEAEVREHFPEARSARLDRDSIQASGSLVRVLNAISHREVDVIIGTQMVAKGHDFPHIALVGVVLADVALSLPDFRAAERAFSLLTQVAGRAGRGALPGLVLIQTYQPDHPSVIHALTHDVIGFAEKELIHRREARYPPYWRCGLLRIEGEDPTAVDARARQVAEVVRRCARADLAPQTWDVLGPAPSGIERLRGKTRHQVFVRCLQARDRSHLLWAAKAHDELNRALRGSRCRLVLDVDPVSVV